MEFAYAFTFVIGIIIVPEISVPGYEGIIYGAITTYINQVCAPPDHSHPPIPRAHRCPLP